MLGIKHIVTGNDPSIEFTSSDNKIGELMMSEKGFLVKGAVNAFEKIVIPCSSAITIDAAKGNIFELTLTENVTSISILNASIGSYLLIIHQDSTIGNYTVAVNSSYAKFPDGTEYTMTATAGATDIFGIFYDGNYFYVNASQNYTTV